jgi:uncharacterized membrane protein
MSTPATNDRWTAAVLEGPWGKILPWLALFTRCMFGLCLLNFGLMMLIISNPNTSPPAADLAAVTIWILLQGVPYLSIAIGLGLVFGIYTTLNSLLACGLTLIVPVVILVGLITQSFLGNSFGPRGNPFGMVGPDLGVGLMFAGYAVVAIPCLVMLVLLSPMSINRYSLDTLMFGKPKPPAFRPGTPSEPTPAGNPFDLEKPEEAPAS